MISAAYPQLDASRIRSKVRGLLRISVDYPHPAWKQLGPSGRRAHRLRISPFSSERSGVGSTTASERSADRIATFRRPVVWAVEPFAAAARLRCTGNFRAQSPGQRHAANILRRRGAAAMSNIDTSRPVHGAAIGHREWPAVDRATSFAQTQLV